jgi:hypothetical protein
MAPMTFANLRINTCVDKQFPIYATSRVGFNSRVTNARGHYDLLLNVINVARAKNQESGQRFSGTVNVDTLGLIYPIFIMCTQGVKRRATHV